MNMVSSNINQWTLLVAMLPIVLSLAAGPCRDCVRPPAELELLMTIGQALVGMLFLVNMVLEWWEAAVLFALWVVQFGFSIGPEGLVSHIHEAITLAYLAWCAVQVIRLIADGKMPAAFTAFREMQRAAV